MAICPFCFESLVFGSGFNEKMIKVLSLNIIAVFIFFKSGYCQDLALHKPYTISEVPNYYLSASPTDKSSLTDGVYTQGYFWSQKTTVGWENKFKVEITIDLGKVEPVGSITFNTAGGTAGVYFPNHIYIFISKDGKNYTYAGDAATGDQEYGTYKVKKLILSNINQQGRYVRLICIPDKKFLFCDEIEVLKGLNEKAFITYDIPGLETGNIVDSFIFLGYERKNVTQIINRLSQKGIMLPQKDERYLTNEAENYSTPSEIHKHLSNTMTNLGRIYASYLDKKYHTSVIIEKYNPWDTLDEMYEPKQTSETLSYHYIIPDNSNDYGSFIVTNSSLSPIAIKYKVLGANPALINLRLFEVPFISAGNGSKVADPVIPFSTFNINPGFSRMIFFKITGLKPGTDHSEIVLTAGRVQDKITMHANIVKIPEGKGCTLNTNVWAYLTYPMIRDRQDQAIEDLSDHMVNTMVIPPAIIPKMEDTDFAPFLNYVSKLKDIAGLKNILLFDNYTSSGYRNGYKGGQFMSSEWKTKFVKWYKNLVDLIHNNGLPSVQIYFYPYDEVNGVKDISDFKKLVLWSKTTLPGIKYFATLSYPESIDSLLPLVDIAQLSTGLNILYNLPPHHAEVWTYEGSSPSRLLSPYSFYRLMAWRAFEDGFTGIGFWDYADEGNGNKLNLITDPLINTSLSYSVIYDGKDSSIISTRRWEAFSEGVEDYKWLCKYAENYGRESAKSLAKIVLANPENTSLADSVRNQILQSIKIKVK